MSQAREFRVRYQADDSSVPIARRQAMDLVREWGVDQLADTVALVVSELVTNAIRHGRTAAGRPVGVTYWLDADRLRVEVRDSGDGKPELGDADTDHLKPRSIAESGRGLLIVDAVSSRWGFEPRAYGKIVWSEIDIDGGEPVGTGARVGDEYGAACGAAGDGVAG